MLSDWSDEDPQIIFANLTKISDFYNFNEPATAGFARNVSHKGLQQGLVKRVTWDQMRVPIRITTRSGCLNMPIEYLGLSPAGHTHQST